MAHGDGTLYAQWGFVTIGGCACDVGGMVGGGIVCEDLLPHHLLGWGVVV
jgi:hypothetical protein